MIVITTIKVFALLLAVIILMGYLHLYVSQDKLIFLRQGSTEDDLKLIRTSHPLAKEMNLTTTDGAKLQGWFRPAESESPSPLLIYFGGNAEEVSYMLGEMRLSGIGFALFNYRGYGLSSGTPTQKALFSDALFIYDTLSSRAEVKKDSIFAMGRSLGSGVATYLTHERDLAGTVLVSPYDSLRCIAQKNHPFTPVGLLLKHPFDSLSIAPEIKSPALALIGTEDDVVAPEHSELLMKNWGGKTVVKIIKNADHNNIIQEPEYWEAIEGFVKRKLGLR